MNKRESYAVRISGLGDGEHEFSFILDRAFFGSLEYSEIEEGNVAAKVILEKKPGILALHFTMSGKVTVICDRCLEPLMTGIEASHVIYLKSGEVQEEIEENVLVIGEDEHEIEVGHLMYEFIVLALPYRRIHPSGEDGISGCDPDMIEKLNAHIANKTGQNDQSDPRWDALKRITEKNK